jgi:transposase
MLRLPASVRVFVGTTPCDMRRQFDGLAALVRSGMGRDPQSGDLYVFRNKRGDMVKALFFDQQGYCLLAKRLSKGTFKVLVDEVFLAQASIEVTAAELGKFLSELTLERRLPARVT